MFNIAVIFLVVTALLAYLNHRFVRLPTTIGVMAIALVLSLSLIGLDRIGFSSLHDYEVSLLESIDFSDVLMQGMLSVLLFAGAMHVDLSELRAYRWQVGLLAVLGTVASTVIVACSLWIFLPLVGVELGFLHCLVFGALISPTDPIAVMGILKSAKAPKNLELVISGESLFNDGVGVVLFSLLLGTIALGEAPTAGQTGLLLLQEAGGGIAYGLVLGYVTYRLLKSIDSYKEEVLLTLAAVLGGYLLATHLHVSGPLAMVVAGLVIGNHGRALAMSDKTRAHLDMFWELLDEILNSVLFVLIGMEALVIPYSPNIAVAAIGTVLITLLARLLAVGTPVALFNSRFRLPRGSWQVLTWGGLRGGISVALALSLPLGEERNIVLALTYAVVVFSILGQGLSIGKVARRAVRAAD
ncbi:cation:proton antiporter [Dokdonella immobilis]|uniref:Sodium/proton antiporter, CPA1 family n=1 Tax=Dokdonella immobilis TaxID=578942 RepID=A0A1I4V5C0_9GAMM|nr:sodium:proton antiporter [Dokdonella immobilis]SFM96427.1 sodium/proton antiporter, CPA1 family [Dokdonella immobilis]